MYINEIAPGMPATVRLVRKDKKHFDITTTVVSLGSAQIEKLRKTSKWVQNIGMTVILLGGLALLYFFGLKNQEEV